MSFKDIFKRQVDHLLSTDRDRHEVSLEQELRDKLDDTIANAIDPGRDEREAARRAADLEQTRTQPGLGQLVQIAGIPGQWEAVELFHYDDTSAAFALVDRSTGDSAQLSAVDDGTVVLDSPSDQHSGTIPGAFWRAGSRSGIRLQGATLTSDGIRSVVVTCDLSAEAPLEPNY